MVRTTNSFSDICNTHFRISSDYHQGFALLMALLHWLFCGKEWKADLVMVSWIGMLLVPLFVIWVLRFFLIPNLISLTWLLFYVWTSNDANVTKTCWKSNLLLCCIGRIEGLDLGHTDKLNPTSTQCSSLFNWFFHQSVSFNENSTCE